MSDYLIHFRTKGSKNGQRLYQREDGTWTAIGLARRRSEYDSVGRKAAKAAAAVGSAATAAGAAATAVAGARGGEEMFKPGKDGKPSPYEKAVKEASSANDKFNKLYGDLDNNKGQDRYDLDDISDSDMDKLITRLKKEKELNALLNEESASAKKGKIHLDEVLAVVGTIASVAASAATIYGILKNAGVIKGKPSKTQTVTLGQLRGKKKGTSAAANKVNDVAKNVAKAASNTGKKKK